MDKSLQDTPFPFPWARAQEWKSCVTWFPTCNRLRSHQKGFRSACSSVRSHQRWTGVPASPHPCRHSFPLIFPRIPTPGGDVLPHRAFTCTFPVTNDLEHLLMCLLARWALLWRNVRFAPWSILMGLSVYYRIVLHIGCKTLSDTGLRRISSYSAGSFHFPEVIVCNTHVFNFNVSLTRLFYLFSLVFWVFHLKRAFLTPQTRFTSFLLRLLWF